MLSLSFHLTLQSMGSLQLCLKDSFSFYIYAKSKIVEVVTVAYVDDEIMLTTVCCRFGSWGLFIKPNIWPIEVTKARRTQPSGPLVLWQCLIYETGEYFSKLYFWQTNTIYQHQGIYKLAWACTSQWALNTRMTIDSISIKSLKVFEKILLFCFVH